MTEMFLNFEVSYHIVHSSRLDRHADLLYFYFFVRFSRIRLILIIKSHLIMHFDKVRAINLVTLVKVHMLLLNHWLVTPVHLHHLRVFFDNFHQRARVALRHRDEHILLV